MSKTAWKGRPTKFSPGALRTTSEDAGPQKRRRGANTDEFRNHNRGIELELRGLELRDGGFGRLVRGRRAGLRQRLGRRLGR
jgi:hypothetical protein